MAFKMKGSPLQRNFNTGDKSPLEQKLEHATLHGKEEGEKYAGLSEEGT